jgi:hypothetical protein
MTNLAANRLSIIGDKALSLELLLGNEPIIRMLNYVSDGLISVDEGIMSHLRTIRISILETESASLSVKGKGGSLKTKGLTAMRGIGLLERFV